MVETAQSSGKDQQMEWGRLRWLWMPAAPSSGSIAVSLGEIRPKSAIPPHNHLGEEQVIIVLSGDGFHAVDGQRLRLVPGESYHVPPDSVHEMIAEGQTSLFFLVAANATQSKWLRSMGRMSLYHLLGQFTLYSGLSARVVSANGSTIGQPSQELDFCRYVCQHASGEDVCRHLMQEAARLAVNRQYPVQFSCCVDHMVRTAIPVPETSREQWGYPNRAAKAVICGPMLLEQFQADRIGQSLQAFLNGSDTGRALEFLTRLTPTPMYRLWSATIALHNSMMNLVDLEGLAVAEPDYPSISLLEAVEQYVETAPPDRLTLSDISQRLGYSISYLSRVFADQAGRNFREYIQEVKIERAKRLLTSTSYSVGQIASLCGYRDISHFGQVFKRLVGMPPSSWQRHRRTRI